MTAIRMNISSSPLLTCINCLDQGTWETDPFVFVAIDNKKQTITITEETEEYTRRFHIPIKRNDAGHTSDSKLFRLYLSKILQVKEKFLKTNTNTNLQLEVRTHTLTIQQGKHALILPIEQMNQVPSNSKRAMQLSTVHSAYRSAFAVGQWFVTQEIYDAIEHSDKPTVTFEIRKHVVQVIGYQTEAFADSEFSMEVRRENLLRFFQGLEIPCSISFDMTEHGPVLFRTLDGTVGVEIEMASIASVPVFVPTMRQEQPSLSARTLIQAFTHMSKLLDDTMPIKRPLWVRVHAGKFELAAMTNDVQICIEVPLTVTQQVRSCTCLLPEQLTEELCRQLLVYRGTDLILHVQSDCVEIQGLQTKLRAYSTPSWPVENTESTQVDTLQLTLGKVKYFSQVIRNRIGRTFSIASQQGMVQICIDSWVIRKKRMAKMLADACYTLPYEQVQTIVQTFNGTEAIIRFSNPKDTQVCFCISDQGLRYSIYLDSLEDFLGGAKEQDRNQIADPQIDVVKAEDGAQTIPESEERVHAGRSLRLGQMEQLLHQMDQWVGLTQIKEQCMKLIKYVEYERRRKTIIPSQVDLPTLHMCFTGNPGTGKTMTARMLGKLLKDIGVLEKGHVVEVDRQKLIGQHIGHTEANFTKYVQQAIGGILFIDEAHSLYKPDSPKDYGHDLIHVLVKAMEDYRDRVVVIVAGYPDAMRAFLDSNIGLRERIPFHFAFPDYTTEELVTIARKLANERYQYQFGHGVEEELYEQIERARVDETFGNARLIRNLVEQAVLHHAARSEVDDTIPEEYYTCLSIEDFQATETREDQHQAVWDQLNRMVGLRKVKETVKQIHDVLVHDQWRKGAGYDKIPALMHMSFTGNPGTGKTTVAQIIARLLKAMKLIKRGHLVEVTAEDLIAPYVGQTVHRTAAKIREALGGVLFIDEAYALTRGALKQFGEEAISTLVKEMDAKRENLVVIFAGYPKAMDEMIRTNPGLKSRIRFQIDFPDYSASELVEIFQQKAVKSGYCVPEDVQETLWEYFIAHSASNGDSDVFGNGRLAEQTFEHARMCLAGRTRDSEVFSLDERMTFCIEDIPIYGEK